MGLFFTSNLLQWFSLGWNVSDIVKAYRQINVYVYYKQNAFETCKESFMASNTTHWFPSSLRVTIKHFCNININRKEHFFPWEIINNIIALSKVYVLFVEICKWYIQILKLFFRRANSRSKGRWISWLSGKSRYETMWCSTSRHRLKTQRC